jgi:hypothetical protein
VRLRKISDCTEHNVAAVRLESASRHAASAAAVSITILRRAFMPSEQIDPPAKTPSDVGQ